MVATNFNIRAESRRLGLYLLIYTLLGLYMFSQGALQKAIEHDPNPWWHYLISWMVGVYVWFLLTPAILWAGRRFPPDRNRWLRRTLTHFALSVAAAVLQLSIESGILHTIGVFPGFMFSFQSTFKFLFVLSFHQALLMYWTIIGIQYGFGWYERYQERRREALRLELRSSRLEGQLAQAHLSALTMQIQPHFLFNTLNAIVVLVRQQKGREAEEMLSRLSDLLRCVLDDLESPEVPLYRELEYVRLYLSIEEVRFRDRLKVDMEIDPQLLDLSVPHLILQPIVENAIRHGIARSSSAGSVRIAATRRGGSLELSVEDDGPGLDTASAMHSSGIGLTNTRARLMQMYGDAATLSIVNREYRGVLATIALPLHVTSMDLRRHRLEAHESNHIAG
jgi:two-component system, LytTR family, sensor kinase